MHAICVYVCVHLCDDELRNSFGFHRSSRLQVQHLLPGPDRQGKGSHLPRGEIRHGRHGQGTRGEPGGQ